MRKKTVIQTLGAVSALSMALHFSALADDPSRFVEGTDINGIEIGGLTEAQARETLENALAAGYQLTVKEKGGKSEVISGAAIGCRVSVPEHLNELLSSQNAGGRQSGPSAANSYSISVHISYDEAALAAQIRSLACISGADIVQTRDASISPYREGAPFSILAEVQGNSLNLERTEAAVRAAVASGASELDLEAAGCYEQVRVTKEDASLAALLERMNACRDMTITYTFGGQAQELTGGEIAGWMTGSENGQISIDREKAAAYIAWLAGTYDTAGTARSFHTTAGAEAVLSGPYGCSMDQAAETEALLAMIQTGQSQERQPQYAKEAASRTAPDWGNTYVEVDLGGQHVYFYRDGACLWDAPCVTGNVEKGHTTPEGIYSLTYKQEDRILRGQKQADGSYEYESHVNYWMPFNGGIGLHDADWREKFGGTIYQYAGSHGCINLPPNRTKELYDQLYTGIPVICHN